MSDATDRFSADPEPGGFVVTQCLLCKHVGEGEEFVCPAFPGGIPAAIVDNEADHRRPAEGDHGIRFEAAPGASKTALESLAKHFERRKP